jgi:hypothetical protein
MSLDKSRLQQMSGHGIPEFEHCPPMYHIDLTNEEFNELVKDSASVLAQLGLPAEPLRITIGEKAWSDELQQWVMRDSRISQEPGDWCTHILPGTGIWGHPHFHKR